jgi:hypothetical protein
MSQGIRKLLEQKLEPGFLISGCQPVEAVLRQAPPGLLI